MQSQDTQAITADLLRYHRKNPLRVAFGTPMLLKQYDGEVIAQVYQRLVEQEKIEAVFHTVERQKQNLVGRKDAIGVMWPPCHRPDALRPCRL